MTASPWFNFAVALALGLLIGLERERTKGQGPTRRAAGIRTFALATLLGALAAHLGGARMAKPPEPAATAMTIFASALLVMAARTGTTAACGASFPAASFRVSFYRWRWHGPPRP